MDLVVLGDDEQAARVAVEPMDDARPQFAGHVAKPIEMKLQARRQRPPVVRLARMGDHPGGFVDDDQRLVFVDDLQRNVFRRERLIGAVRGAAPRACRSPADAGWP